MRSSAVIFGAGNIGRGFIGQLFSASGYDLTFVDVMDDLIEAINRANGYTIDLVDNESRQEVRVSPARALHSGRQTEQAGQAVAGADLAATAVGARVLPLIAPIVARGISLRRRNEVRQPLNMIICENLKDAAAEFRQMVYAHLDEGDRSYAGEMVGFVDTVIGRMVPPPSEEQRRADPARILVEPYAELPVDRSGFKGSIPEISGMQPCDNFPVYTARKLYIHNCGHAVLAYHGYLKGYEFGYEALVDAQVRAMLDRALAESKDAIVKGYGADAGWLEQHIADLLRRFANRALGDTIFRLGRDPLRKLAPKDRLIGPLRLAEQNRVSTDALSRAVAAGYCFAPAEDPLAQELQQLIKDKGIAVALEQVSGIGQDEALSTQIIGHWRELSAEKMP